MKTLGISFLLLLSVVMLNGQNKRSVMFKHLTIKEQLSHYSVMALYQDERGLIWIGTRNGVNVYDGSELHTYRRDWGQERKNLLPHHPRCQLFRHPERGLHHTDTEHCRRHVL